MTDLEYEKEQDMMDEYNQDAQREALYSSDYEAFMSDEVDPIVDEIFQLLADIQRLHESYGWEYIESDFVKDNIL